MPSQPRLESTTASMEGPLPACAAGTLPPNVALAQLITLAETPAMVESSIRTALRAYAAGSAEQGRLSSILALWHGTPSAWDTVRGVLAHARHDDPEVRSRWADVFDSAARVSPSAGVALYSLGRADLLAAATAGIVARMREWMLLGPERVVLDLGCGSGRLVAALAPEVRMVVGADISPGMLTAARRHCAAHANVMLVRTSGRDLAAFRDGGFDVVVAVDVFPYLVSCSGDLVETHLTEARRVLAPGGAFLILNFAYGRDDQAQAAEVAERAGKHGFSLVRIAAGDFALWDGRTFHLRRER